MNGNVSYLAAQDLKNAMTKEDGTLRTYDEMVAEGIPTKYSGVYSNIGQCTPINEDDGHGNPVSDQNFIVSVELAKCLRPSVLDAGRWLGIGINYQF